MKNILQDLSRAAAVLDVGTVERITQKISRAERIFVYGAGRSGLMLRAFAMRLMQMGKTVYVVGETITPAIGPGDVLVLASASGKTHSVCHYAQEGQAAGAELLVISASQNSPLSGLQTPDVLLSAPNTDSAASNQIMGTLFEQMLLLLCDAACAAMHPDAQAMRQRHANLE